MKYFLLCKILVNRDNLIMKLNKINNFIYFRKILNFNFFCFFVEVMLYFLNFCGKDVE